MFCDKVSFGRAIDIALRCCTSCNIWNHTAEKSQTNVISVFWQGHVDKAARGAALFVFFSSPTVPWHPVSISGYSPGTRQRKKQLKTREKTNKHIRLYLSCMSAFFFPQYGWIFTETMHSGEKLKNAPNLDIWKFSAPDNNCSSILHFFHFYFLWHPCGWTFTGQDS